MKLILSIIRGAVIGLANIIPGVSGGTMMVSMGIYDTLIYCINHLFKDFRRSILTLLPYIIGMLAAIGAGAVGLKAAFRAFPLPTNMLFIGLILGSVPTIGREMKGEKKGIAGGFAFLLSFALVVFLKAIEAENIAAIRLDLFMVIKLFLMGCMCSSAMVIPGISGSMLLKTLGYYEPVVTEAIPGLLQGITSGNGEAIVQFGGILLPYVLGLVAGIFLVAKLIAVLLKRWKGVTYCAILGMVLASPVVVLMDAGLFTDSSIPVIILSVELLALGLFTALKLGGEPETKPGN